MGPSSVGRGRALLAIAAAAVLVASVATTGAGAAPAAGSRGTARPDLAAHQLWVGSNAARHGLPAGLPASGPYAFLLSLQTASTLASYDRSLVDGRRAAAASARLQLGRIRTAQSHVVQALPHGSHLLYETHNALAGVAVVTDVHNYAALQDISGVRAVYPIAPKRPSNSYAVRHVGAPVAWNAGHTGSGVTIAVIDTGIDYTHGDFGGTGTRSAYLSAKANDTSASWPKNAKVIGGYDFAGDAYNPDANIGPTPDANPLDCEGHGTHVAGIAAGYGENPNGTTYTGGYASLSGRSARAYQNLFEIGPGMAPNAKLLAYKVFGCTGSTNLVGRAIDRAIDPNRDGSPADHADVINMSLGSDFTSRQDADAVLSNAASRAGITVVAAAGNAGDEYDASGSPGNAVRAISVANSVDAYSELDTLDLLVNGSAQRRGAERSVLYKKWRSADLTGAVKRVTQAGNADGCQRVSQDLTNKVALVTWHDAAPHCPSKTVATNLHNAGARGFILGNDTETFSAGINGNAAIPGVVVTASGMSAIKNALPNVTVTGTGAADFPQLLPRLNDKVNTSSSRGIRAAGDVKPDVSGVGTSVFSAAMGSGAGGVSFSGTSMASPMVAGLAALICSAHSSWTPEQVKADIMNTAGQDLYTGSNHTGTRYAPNRVGAGRVDAAAALRNQVLAFVRDNPGAVSVSFGSKAVTGATSWKKTVKVVNKSSGTVHFNLGYRAITSVPGVRYALSRTTIGVAAHSSNTFAVRLVAAHPGRMTKTRDRTVAAKAGRLPREFLSDASGRIVLTPVSGTSVALRVPVYAAPRPASQMHEDTTLAMHGGSVQHGALHLLGHGVVNGSGASRVQSVVSGFELAARSGLAPRCRTARAQDCVHFADDRAADLRYVGVTSDTPLRSKPMANGEAYFSITTHQPWSTPAGTEQFQIGIDTNGDNTVDAILYNTRLGTSDVFLSELVDVSGFRFFVRDDELINDRYGNLDTALFDSDTMVLPLRLRTLGAVNGHRALPGFSSTHTRIRYGVLSFGEGGLVDSVGVNLRTGRLSSSHLTTDVLHPGIEVYNNSIRGYDTRGLLLNSDRPDTTLTVRRDRARYRTDGGKGVLVVHFHNRVGVKAQVVTLKSF
jgi:subtilisin family serine protease